MRIVRNGKDTKLTLAVTAQGRRRMTYVTARDGKPEGGGLMQLIDDDQAWVDITGSADGSESSSWSTSR